MDRVFKCPVCHQALQKNEKTYSCPSGHSYDIAKKGYVNLLLANQGNHFIEEGDKKGSIACRTRFLESGAYSFLRDELVSIIRNTGEKSFCDLACGEGYYTTYIHSSIEGMKTVGVDISKSAIQASCTRKNVQKLENIEFCIGNLDYLPFMDESFGCLLNCFAPINEKEFLRVAKKGGIYLRVLPGERHLLEMKEVLYSRVRLNVQKEEKLEGFSLINKKDISQKIKLSHQQISDLFEMTPYAYKTSKEAIERLLHLEELETTLEFSIYCYQKD